MAELLSSRAPLVAINTGSTISGGRLPRLKKSITTRTSSRENNIPVLTATGGSSSKTASICRRTICGAQGSIARTTCGFCAVMQVTAQNPQVVRAIEPCAPQMVRRQIEAVFEELPPVAVKTGMLFSRELVRVVIDFFKRGRRPPLIVDPVLIATSGARLLKSSAIGLFQKDLLPLAV